jgi:hypothetical protein
LLRKGEHELVHYITRVQELLQKHDFQGEIFNFHVLFS